MTLDTSGNWVSGDDLRIIECLGVPFGSYTLKCIGDCANQLEDMSVVAVDNVRAALEEYETAKNAKTVQDLSEKEGKTLVKADVLEWEVKGGSMSGLEKELSRSRAEVVQYFAFCSCLDGLMGNYSSGGTPLVRS